MYSEFEGKCDMLCIMINDPRQDKIFPAAQHIFKFATTYSSRYNINKSNDTIRTMKDTGVFH